MQCILEIKRNELYIDKEIKTNLAFYKTIPRQEIKWTNLYLDKRLRDQTST